MIKLNTFTPQGKIVRKVSDAAKNLKQSKNANFNMSALPKEEPLDSVREKQAIFMLQDSYAFDRAKNSILISSYAPSEKPKNI